MRKKEKVATSKGRICEKKGKMLQPPRRGCPPEGESPRPRPCSSSAWARGSQRGAGRLAGKKRKVFTKK